MRADILAALAIFVLATARAEASEPKRPEAPAAGKTAAAAPLSQGDLGEISGGDGVAIEVLTKQNLSATVTNNNLTAGTVESGAVNFGANALNFNGIGNFVVNTGNNNVLQGSLSVIIVNGPGP